ncbi:hypothetical protein [Paenibacillus sacheonensis]|uniref:Uncharacterized protein n=1 Tax=Paenibacillus sacheonensis TaxID=742054 RepID=A0A7X5BZ01_9BACL|nr:hypothetical protein [Paenibacillus sacheonensis]MBM7565266.1 hypothetical protein [Paenibacillus sacheonensis]NBC69961.1 hypothetical protein [Paenibacillus sacheonensis]
MSKVKGFHFKVDKEEHRIVQSFFKKNQHLNMSGTFRDLILIHISQQNLKQHG